MKPVMDLPQSDTMDTDGVAFVRKGDPVDFGPITKSEGIDVATTMSIADQLEAIKKANKEAAASRPKYGPPKTYDKDA